MMHGACFLPWTKRSRTREAPTPTNISTKSEPEIEKNGTPASPAIARAQQGLAGAGRPHQQHALGDSPTQAGKPFGVLQELDNLFQFVLGLIDPGDVGKRDLV